jgi:hypothetical protein
MPRLKIQKLPDEIKHPGVAYVLFSIAFTISGHTSLEAAKAISLVLTTIKYKTFIIKYL